MAKATGNTKAVFAPRRKGVKLSTMNKHKRRNFKKYRGQSR